MRDAHLGPTEGHMSFAMEPVTTTRRVRDALFGTRRRMITSLGVTAGLLLGSIGLYSALHHKSKASDAVQETDTAVRPVEAEPTRTVAAPSQRPAPSQTKHVATKQVAAKQVPT